MTRRGWTWGVPGIGGLLLAVAFLLHGSAGRPPVRQRPGPTVAEPERRIRSVRETTVEASSLASAARIVPEAALIVESDLLDEPGREARTEIVRESFWKYRSAVACDDEEAERALYPLLLLDRETSLACAREEIAGASTELDRELSKKAEKALIARITESEAP